LSPRELSATLMLTTGGMTGRLDKLERAGSRCRSAQSQDRRPEGDPHRGRLRLIDEAVGAGLAEEQRPSALDADDTGHLAGSCGSYDADVGVTGFAGNGTRRARGGRQA
ncbi:hypothetical protein LT493_02710, partial [Streptomyces tricolor]|nr:hypothetical protein [Streptomyces tricolor]